MSKKINTNPDYLRFLGIVNDRVFVGPEMLLMNMTGSCNLNCIHCWYHSKLKDRSHNKIEFPFEKFMEIVDDCASMHTKTIVLSGEGDPFMHSKIIDMIKYTREKKLHLTIVTNATFSEKYLKYMPIIDELLITLSAGTQRVYEEIQDVEKKGFFKALTRNLIVIKKMRGRGIKCPKIVLNFIINDKNYKDLENFFGLANNFGVNEVKLVVMHYEEEFFKKIILSKKSVEEFKSILKKLIENKKLTGNVNSNLEEVYDVFSNKNFLDSGQRREFYSGNKRKPGRCFFCWFQTFIELNCDVKPCCRRGDINIGNILDKSFKEIWNSDEYKKVRYYFKTAFDLNKDVWRNCNLCQYADLNRPIEKRLEKFQK